MKMSNLKAIQRSKSFKAAFQTEKVYDQQLRLAGRVMDTLELNEKKTTKNKRTPIIALQMQQGKTGVMEVVIYLFILACIRQKKTFQIVLLCGLAETSLRDQTEARVLGGNDHNGRAMGADLGTFARSTGLTRYQGNEDKGEGIIILNNSQKLKNLRLSDKGVDVRLVLCDEVHIGNGKDGNIDTFFKNIGIEISQQLHTWRPGKPVNHVVGVSATPFAHHIYSDGVGLGGDALFTPPMYEEPVAAYNSLEKMIKKGRIQQAEKLFLKEGTPSAFFLKVLSDFNKHKNGYLVLRAQGKNHQMLMAWLSKNGRNLKIREFDSDKKNLDGLSDALSRPTTDREIIVIRGGMRAGITIRTGLFIRAWVENPKSTNTDTSAQAAFGRACGYNKDKEMYVIYGDLEKAHNMVAYYHDLRDGKLDGVVPSGITNKCTKEKLVQRHPFVDFVSEAEGANRQRIKRAEAKRRAKGVDRNQAQLVRISTNFYNNIAEMALKECRDSSATIGVIFDGPPTIAGLDEAIRKAKLRDTYKGNEHYYTPARVKELQRSWELLAKKHPKAAKLGLVGMYGEESVTVALGKGDRDSYQRRDSALLH